MVRILFVFDRFVSGGIETVGLSYLRALKEHDIKIDVLIVGDTDPVMLARMSEYAVPHCLKFNTHLPGQISSNKHSLFDYIYKRINRLTLPIILMYLRIIVLHCYHDKYNVLIAFSGHPFDIQICSLISASRKIVWMHESPFRKSGALHWVIRDEEKFDQIVCITAAAKDVVKKKISDISKVSLIYNPISINKSCVGDLAEKSANIKRKYGPYLVVVGRIDLKAKDLNTVIAAYKDVVKMVPFLSLVFVGDGEDMPRLVSSVGDLGLNNKVHFLGERDDAIAYILAAEALVLSSYSEGFSLVIAEAMSLGTPVIASDCPVGPRELLDSGSCGLLFPVGDAPALGKCIIELMSNKNDASARAAVAKRRAEKFYVDEAVCQLLALLGRLGVM